MAGLGRWHGVFTSRAQRRATRQNLHVLTTPEQAYIESGIRPVVDVLNRFGLTTIASCEGHPWRAMEPYVMFRAPVGVAGLIERFFREEEVNAASELRSSWFVVPAFDSGYELAFSIVGRGGVAEPTLPGLFSSPRKHLDELRRLAGKLEVVLQHARVQEALKSFRRENEVGVIYEIRTSDDCARILDMTADGQFPPASGEPE
jgi:hypothetical protein